MADARRAIVTQNWATSFVARLALEGRDHYGLVLTPGTVLSRSRNTIGRYGRALEALLAALATIPSSRPR